MDKAIFGQAENTFSLLQDQYEKALQTNETSTLRWETYKENLEEAKKNLGHYSKQLKCPIMIPISKKAFMKGSLVHTNECFVCLGDGWFVKQSAAQTEEFCTRRIEYCDEKLNSLKKELDLFESRKTFPVESDVFAQDSAQEIIEPFDEEVEAAWRVKHREKEKEHRKKLAEQRKKEASKVEEDVWEKLSRLELEEKSGKEESIDQTDNMNEDDEYLDEEDYSTDTLSDEFVEEEEDETQESVTSGPKTERKRSVTFDLEDHDSESNYDDVIMIEFKHSQSTDSSILEPKAEQNSENKTIEKPSDIYHCYSHLFKPKSILKKPACLDQELISRSQIYPDSADTGTKVEAPSHNIFTVTPVPEDIELLPQVFGEIIERKVADLPKPPPESSAAPVKSKVSKFKAARKATS